MTTLLNVISNNETDLVEKVKSFIAQGDDISRVTEYGESALRISSDHGRFDVVKVLLGAGADSDQLGWSKTIYEVVYGTAETIKQSVQKNDDLESTDYWERTPFLFAVQLGEIEKAQLLLDLGANRLAAGRCGKTSMQYAIQHNHVPMLRWLVSQGFDIESTDEFLGNV